MSEIQNNALPIRYRKGTLAPEFETEEEEHEATRAFVQEMIGETTRETVVDSVLMLANICEMRANLIYGAPRADRKSTRLNSSHSQQSRMPSSA